MLDLKIGADLPAGWWLTAPMPAAALYALAGDHLRCLHADGTNIRLADGLRQALAVDGPARQTLAATDAAGASWRLRRSGRLDALAVWQVQAVDETRRHLLRNLRSTLSARLSGLVLHELRNPLNALSLHAGLMSSLLAQAGAAPAERLLPSARLMRERLADLEARQSDMVSLWLADAERSEAEAVSVAQLAEDTVRFMRGQFAASTVQVQPQGLAPLAGWPAPASPVRLKLSLIALLLMACDAAAGSAPAAGRVELRSSAAAAPHAPPFRLELRGALDASMIYGGLAEPGEPPELARMAAALALLLEPDRVGLELLPGDGGAAVFPLAPAGA